MSAGKYEAPPLQHSGRWDDLQDQMKVEQKLKTPQIQPLTIYP